MKRVGARTSSTRIAKTQFRSTRRKAKIALGAVRETAYLARVREVAEKTSGRAGGENAPAPVRDDPNAQGILRTLSEIVGLKGTPADEVAELAKELTDIVRSRLIVRFWANNVALGELRTAMDDYLFDLAPDRDIALSPAQIDAVIRETLRVAQARSPR